MGAPDVDATALAAAAARARETARRDALFRDPYAARLAGGPGAGLRDRVQFSAVAARTAVFDELVLDAVHRRGAKCVLSLGAGLDTRPYRLALPPELRWVEADRPAVIERKTSALAHEKPVCTIERFAVDLADPASRGALLGQLAQPTLVLSEGVLMYLEEGDVAALASELAATPDVGWWALDLAGPSVVSLLRAGRWSRARAEMRFAPTAGAEFFRRFGWAPVDARSSWAERRRLGREPLLMRALWAVSPPRTRASFRRLGTFVVLERAPVHEGP